MPAHSATPAHLVPTPSFPAERDPALRLLGAEAERDAGLAPAPGGIRVLVVDDNHDAADSLCDLLGALGYDAVAAYDPAQAIAAAAERLPQVAILDIGLPGMDGFELAVHLRALPRGAALRLVALSGYGREHDKSRSRAAGFAAHLVKPVNLADLQAVLGGATAIAAGAGT